LEGWDVEVWDDVMMEEKFRSCTGGESGEGWKLRDMWDSLPKTVMKSDLIR